MSKLFIEFIHENGLILLLSKIILMIGSVSAALVFVVIIGFYIFNVLVLPIRSVEVLMDWYLPHISKYGLHSFISFITDIVNCGLGNFLGITYVSNYFCILHFFITDSIGKLQ